MGVVVASGAGALVDVVAQGLLVAASVGEDADGVARGSCCRPSGSRRPSSCRIGRRRGLAGDRFERGAAGVAFSVVADFGEQLGGGDDAFGVAEEREEDFAVVVGAQRARDLAGQQPDLLDLRPSAATSASTMLRRASSSASPGGRRGPARIRSSSSLGASAAAVAVTGKEAGEPFASQPACVGGAGVAFEEGERDRRVDVGEDLLGAGPEGVELGAQLVGERDSLLDQVLAGAGQRLERLRLVAVGLEQPADGACRCGRAQPAHRRRSRRTCRRRCGSGHGRLRAGSDGRHDRDACVEQPVDDQPIRLLDRDSRHPQLSRRRAIQRLDPVLPVADPPLAQARLPSPSTTTSRCSSLARSSPAVRSSSAYLLGSSGWMRADRRGTVADAH